MIQKMKAFLFRRYSSLQYNSQLPILLSQVSPGGVAAQDGRLKVGQRILEVNGQSLVGASHVMAVRIMKDVQEELILVVCNGFDPSSEEPYGSTASMHSECVFQPVHTCI